VSDRESIAVVLTPAELVLLNNALNEVCNGVHIDDEDFATRLGGTRDEVRAILDRVRELLTDNP
jgi:hypothetical protein